ncbi:PREDICTED: EKC/KEOPS complex subunit LAGE3-like isoform X3 [Hipposideros armiger]|uniref:EKC/KEOPS complex subunit LAGE3-like isoform X3 n=1 Tax=Hipposideros armiger TaxID=186990 RepID=A0A8B7Q6H6_HIPAR|nr:PREDICTED: EKC/KEOPS complex subunit LAGE3-like isoform X3 [Hipposideros armiger]
MDSEGNRAVAAALVQAADEGAGEAPGAQGSPGGPEGLGLAGIAEGQGGPGGPCGPSGAGGPDDQSGPGSPNDQDDNNQGGPGVLGGPGVGAEGSAAEDAPSVVRAAHASGPGGDAAAGAVGPGNQHVVFMVTVPFESFLEAEMASLAMETDIQHPWQGVQKEVTVNGSVLVVRWIAEDTDRLRVSIYSFLERLSVVFRNIQLIRHLLPTGFDI